MNGNDELQKAIDDITNDTSGTGNFSDAANGQAAAMDGLSNLVEGRGMISDTGGMNAGQSIASSGGFASNVGLPGQEAVSIDGPNTSMGGFSHGGTVLSPLNADPSPDMGQYLSQIDGSDQNNEAVNPDVSASTSAFEFQQTPIPSYGDDNVNIAAPVVDSAPSEMSGTQVESPVQINVPQSEIPNVGVGGQDEVLPSVDGSVADDQSLSALNASATENVAPAVSQIGDNSVVTSQMPGVEGGMNTATIPQVDELNPAAAPQMPEVTNVDTVPQMSEDQQVENSSVAPEMGGGLSIDSVDNQAIESDGGVAPDIQAIKEKALVDIYPLLSKMNINPDQAFRICMKVFRNNGDAGALKAAYDATARMNEDSKAQALFEIIEATE